MTYRIFCAEMVMLVSPIRLGIEEGTPASFQCLVFTDTPTNTIVTWEYGLEVLSISSFKKSTFHVNMG